MTTTGRVISVDQVEAKGGAPAWQIVTDYAVHDADGLCRCGIWLPRPGPTPAIGETVSWGSAWFKGWAEWQGQRHSRLELSFDPNDHALFTG